MHEILLIDDKFPRWQPVLEKTAHQLGYVIIAAATVEDGLRKISNYPDTIDAVIMGLTFDGGGMQGREGLQKIREIDGTIPVIILTARTDDFQLVSECIRLGAHDYFSKVKINTDHLFLQVENAIQQSHQKKKLTNLKRIATEKISEAPFFLYSADHFNDYTGYFAYRLSTISGAAFHDRHETEYLVEQAYEWHSNLLSLLSFYDNQLKLRLRYIVMPGNAFIDTVLIVEFKARSFEHASDRFKELHQEFDLILQTKRDFGKTVYSFSAVQEERDLKNVLFPFNTSCFERIIPEPGLLEPLKNKPVGFSSSKKSKSRSTITLPCIYKPALRLDRFCEQLILQKKSTMVELVISPARLSRQDVDYLRDIFTNIDSYRLTDPEKEKVCNGITGYLNAPSKCFRLEVFQARQSRRISENLMSAVSSAFFGNGANVKIVPQIVNKRIILKNQDSQGIRFTWNELYSMDNVMHVFRLPYPSHTTIPGIRNIHPVFGFIPPLFNEDGVLAGFKDTGNEKIPVRIGIEDLMRHLYIMGQTGTGKSTLLYTMIMDRIASGQGVCVIDPHGDLHKRILENIPPGRKRDVIAFEPGNPSNTMKINLLEYNKENPQEKSFLIDDLFSFFRQEYRSDTMGPMFELFMKNALLLLMDDPEDIGSIDDVARVFQNYSFRKSLIEKCRDQEVVDFWTETALQLTGEVALVNMSPYIVSKLNQLLINEYIRPVVANKKSNIHFREVIDGGKILLVSLSKGKIGGIGVNVLGTILLSRLINAAMSRSDTAEESRRDFTLFVDEFQNFFSHALINAMSESRKYRLSLILANQTLGQLNDNIKQAVLGNVGSTVFFRPGISDVDYIMPYFTPYLSRDNILTLPNYKCIGRIQINNALSLPFIFDTIEPDTIGAFLKK